MMSIQEALDAMMPVFAPGGSERLPLVEALGRHLSQAIAIRDELPLFDNSAMDGYAVRAEWLAGASEARPVRLAVNGESRAGGKPPGPLVPGAAMRIFTGAQIPSGADAVVLQEDVEVRGEVVVFSRPAPVGQHVRAKGSDAAKGDVLLPRGAWLGPGELGLCAAQRIATVGVFRRPRVAILSTGDELREVHDELGPGTIVNSNAYALGAQVRLAGGEPVVLPNVGDELDRTVEALEQALTCEVVLTCGGVSVGAYDLVKDAMATLGIEAAFWKVSLRPGKPITFGRKGRVPVVGLPGNPVSAMVAFEALVRPGLRRMLGDERPYRMRHLVNLAHEHRHPTGRTELARAKVEMREGRLWARLHANQGSGALPSAVGVDALVLLDADREAFAAGQTLPALLLRDEVGSAVSPFR